MASPSDRPEIQLALAVALHKSGQDKEAKKVLDALESSAPDINTQRLYNLGEIARGSSDEDGFLRYLGELRQSAPTSLWLQQALLSAGNFYLLKPDYDKAIDAYRELQQRFPNAGRASYAHWKVAWLSLRQGRTAEAKAGFEQQIGLYPTSAEVPAALYWRARLAEEDKDTAMARAYYQKLSERFRNFYYGELARRRLREIPVAMAILRTMLCWTAFLRSTPGPASRPPIRRPTTCVIRRRKCWRTAACWILPCANCKPRPPKTRETGWRPRPRNSTKTRDAMTERFSVFKRAVPNYFAVDLPTLPRPYWEALFPKPYWPDLKKFSSQNALDPYLVASLIRQESEFNPGAVSRANALGLMQLLPKVGSAVAKQEKLRHFSSDQLFTPEVNLQLGTRYFREMVDKFGAFEYALAAYNAGTNRVDDWLGQGKYRDPQEFVESIPFTETREYVQAILRNANVYRQLYGAP